MDTAPIYAPISELQENFMIIPIIGLSGQIAAGKITASKFIEKEFNFKCARYSEVLKYFA